MQTNLTFSAATQSSSSHECPYMSDPYFDHVDERFWTNIWTSVINGVLSPFAFLGNLFTIFVLWKNPTLHSPGYVLLGCLAASDLLVGSVVQPAYVIYKIGELVNKRVSCFTMVFYYSCATIGSGVSFITLTAITCERYMALFFHLRYAHLVTYKAVFSVCAGGWFISIAAILLWLMGFNSIHTGLQFTVVACCFVTTLFAYARIFCLAQRHKKQIRAEQRRVSQISASHRFTQQMKVTVTTIFIVASYFLCFLPFFTVGLFELFHGFDAGLREIYGIVETLAYAASSLNPIIYCWRNAILRQTMFHYIQRVKTEIFGLPVWDETS